MVFIDDGTYKIHWTSSWETLENVTFDYSTSINEGPPCSGGRYFLKKKKKIANARDIDDTISYLSSSSSSDEEDEYYFTSNDDEYDDETNEMDYSCDPTLEYNSIDITDLYDEENDCTFEFDDR